jgi:hypothetical protein
MLLRTVQSHKIDPKLLITHRFKFDRILDALRHPRTRGEHSGAQGDHYS